MKTKTQIQTEQLIQQGMSDFKACSNDILVQHLDTDNYIYIKTIKQPFVTVNHSKTGNIYRVNVWYFDNLNFAISQPDYLKQFTDSPLVGHDCYLISLNKKYLTKEKIDAIEEASKGFDDFELVTNETIKDGIFIKLRAQNRKLSGLEKAIEKAQNK